MKTLITLLAVSLAANAWIFTVEMRRSKTSASNQTSIRGSAVASGNTAKSSAATATDAGEIVPGVAVGVWKKLETADLKTLVARLKLAGFSDSLIRGIIFTKLHEQSAPQRLELMGTDYWRGPDLFGGDLKKAAAYRKISRDESNMLKELLGSSTPPTDAFSLAMTRRQYGDLSPEKYEQIRRVQSDYAELRNEIYENNGGLVLPGDRAKLAYLEKESKADLEKIFTPEEFEQYELRSSRTANAVRARMGAFASTEDEYKSLFQAQRNLESRLNGSSAITAEQTQQLATVSNALSDEAKNVLTPERYAEYLITSDPQYMAASRLAVRLDLPETAAASVVTVHKDIEQRATALRNDNSLTSEQRSAQLNALAAEAEGKISTAFGGQNGLEAYKLNGGQWLATINRQPTRTTPRR